MLLAIVVATAVEIHCAFLTDDLFRTFFSQINNFCLQKNHIIKFPRLKSAGKFWSKYSQYRNMNLCVCVFVRFVLEAKQKNTN